MPDKKGNSTVGFKRKGSKRLSKVSLDRDVHLLTQGVHFL
jgi:hypothetical protein